LSNFLRLTRTSSVKIKFRPVQLTSYWYLPIAVCLTNPVVQNLRLLNLSSILPNC